ncbi:MAG: hypothetical protein U5Q44_14385 [Dehalococcoidia bacterium]|nr:hypothetical protein [Dehalococcoidia bacterium]
MYIIRSFGEQRSIILECSGELDAPEATRAIAQVAALAEVDLPRAVICDLRAVERGPEDALAVAAALSASASPAYRIAIVASREQQPFVRRLLRVARLPHAPAMVESLEEAHAWLAQLHRGIVASSTGRRHARDAAQQDPARHRRAGAGRASVA